MLKTFKIPADNLVTLTEKIVKLQRRADRLGVEAPAFEIGERFVEKKVEFVNFTVDCSEIVVAGWTLIAKIDFEGGSTFISHVPGTADLPEQFRAADNHCDHCSNSRTRKTVFVLQNEAGEFIQVGSSCLSDFLGQNAEFAALTAQFVVDAETLTDPDGWATGGFVKDFSPRHVLTVTASVIRQHRWMSIANARKINDEIEDASKMVSSTFSRVHNILFPSPKEKAEAAAFLAAITEEDKALALDALEWAKNVEVISDFLHNVKAIASADSIKPKRLGFAVSIIAAFQRSLEKEEERVAKAAEREAAKKEAQANSDHVGQVGDKLELEVTVTGRNGFEGRFGWTTIVSMKDATGNVFKWFASNCPEAVKAGDTIKIKGTVKGHGEFRDIKETTLTRCKIAA